MTTPELPAHDEEYLRLAEYLEGECSAADAAQIEREFVVDSRLQNAAEFLRLALDATRDETTLNTDAGWADLTRRMDETRRPRSRVRRRLKRFEMLLAATVVLVFGWTTYVSLAPVVEGHVNERYEAPMESHRIIRLPDGSRVTLEPGARLTYRASYFPRPRALTLEGEARFQVRPDAERPFEVRANGTLTRAVGTVFTVRANSWETSVHVAVEEGTVLVWSDAGRPTGPRRVTAGGAIDLLASSSGP